MEKRLNDAHAELAMFKAQSEGGNVKTPGASKRTSPNAAVEPSLNPPAKKLKSPETPYNAAPARGPCQPQARHSGAHFINLSLK